MLAIALLVGIIGLAAVVVGNYLQHVVAPRTLGSISPFVEVLAPNAPSTGALPRAPHLRAVRIDEPHGRRRPLRPRLRRPSASVVLFLVCFVAYATVGGILVLHYGSIVGDAQSRVANAWYVLFSRDPHLAAIGFVWNPLPSVLETPLLLFKGVWPALTERAFAGNLVSALCGAGCVVQFVRLLEELRISKPASWTLTALFALNPMFVYYSANGMSETMYLLFLIWACRYLTQWLRTFHVRPLVLSGVMFALGYLARYEMAAAALVVTVTVALVTYGRSPGTRAARRRLAIADTIVFGLPFAAAFLGWALVSYVITGEAFIQLNPNAGNALLIRTAGGITTHSLGGTALPVFAAEQFLAFGPLLPILAVWAAARFWIRRDPRVLAAVPFLGALVFTYAVFVTGGLFPWFRYYLPALPASLILVGVLLPRRTAARSGVHRGAGAPGPVVALALAVGLVGLVTTSWAMWDQHLGAIERGSLAWIVNGGPQNASDRGEKLRIKSVQSIAADLDHRRLASGDVVVDTDTQCVSLVLMNLQRPHVFVVPSDRDWERRLADPVIFHSHYLLVPPPEGNSALDSVGRSFPGLYENGGNLATLVKEYDTPSCPKFRLYRLLHSPDLGHGNASVN